MTTDSLILVVDDDASVLKLVRLELSEQGFRVITAENGADGIRLAMERRPDLVVLDLMLPDLSGIEVMHQVRDRIPAAIILLSAMASDAHKVRGLDIGADDYVGKPFSPEELRARVAAVLRRPRLMPAARTSTLHFREIEIDLDRRLLLRHGQIVPLARKEWELLQILAANAGRVTPSAELLISVWGEEHRDDIHLLRIWVSRLRKKLEPDRPQPSLIRTMPGVGYRLEAPSAEDALHLGEQVSSESERAEANGPGDSGASRDS